MGKENIKDSCKDSAATGEGVLVLGLLAGLQGPEGVGWPFGAGGQFP